jgi:hypothetical protein
VRSITPRPRLVASVEALAGGAELHVRGNENNDRPRCGHVGLHKADFRAIGHWLASGMKNRHQVGNRDIRATLPGVK